MGDGPPVELLVARLRLRGVNTDRGERVNMLSHLARAGRHSQRCVDQLHTRRLRKICRPFCRSQREMRIRQQHAGSAAGSEATPQQLRERQDQHRADQAAQVARPDAPPGQLVHFNCCKAGRSCNYPHKACIWTVCGKCKWVGPSQRDFMRHLVPV